MGGENEKPLTSTKPTGAAPAKTLTGTARIHEDRGMVHLHEGGPGDKSKLKVSVPSFEYHDRLLKWVQHGMQGPLVFIDMAAGTQCVITQRLPVASSEAMDVDLVWSKAAFAGNLKALVEHAEAR